jgi:hypothetical protein
MNSNHAREFIIVVDVEPETDVNPYLLVSLVNYTKHPICSIEISHIRRAALSLPGRLTVHHNAVTNREAKASYLDLRTSLL